MSVKVSSWVWHGAETAGLSGNEMILMLALADVADDSGRCRYLAEDEDLSYASLSRKARVSRSTLIRLLAGLREAGLLEQKKGVKSRPNEFRILVPWVAGNGSNLEPNGSAGSADSVSSETDSVSSATPFGVKPDERTSLIDVVNVRDVSSSVVASDVLPSEYSDDVVRLCSLLADAVAANGHKVGVVGKTWWAACERLMRLDGYSAEQVEWMIRWATSDEFWAANIRSMPTLREKFSTLKAQAQRQARRRSAESPTARAMSVVEMGRRLAGSGVAS